MFTREEHVITVFNSPSELLKLLFTVEEVVASNWGSCSVLHTYSIPHAEDLSRYTFVSIQRCIDGYADWYRVLSWSLPLTSGREPTTCELASGHSQGKQGEAQHG